MNTILFSGRFDKPHAGHIITIQRLGQVYDKVIVCVLDYPEAKYPIDFRMGVLTDALINSKGNYIVIKNKNHLGEITAEEIFKLPYWSVFGSGNEEVVEHIKSILGGGYVVYVPRYPGYAASKEEE